MDIVLYLILSFIDVMAILSVIFRFFRFPIRLFIRELVTIGAVLTVTSFFMRLVFNIPELDMGMQYILYIVLFRYLIKIKIFESFLLASIGYLSIALSQLAIYYFFAFTGIVTPEDIQSTSNFGTYLIQISSQVFLFLVAWCFYKKNLGFSFMICPPQDVHLKVKMRGLNLFLLIGIMLSVATLFLAPYLLIYYLNWLHILAFIMTIIFCLLYYAANKKDEEDLW
ncbi:hypothetical protein [Brevibacillus laterosporus]|uniref:hypothetical protein n=1 Tax=Brevibacillus laterosporus TaxID=1465 RepID=UPI0018F86838|nr:hypothetical protein [Brevibacillus laterosporus]MBG9776162.1 hypothetical protein [Brevibacillus laterosporus]MED1665733.1 hypothetical protein [Brevibacillus laterosporus]MED1667178.1 hypothetical protein [Brevibacillus laterosporus]MED1719754.1 hypothetical protein [Brevibacillus laterosporus]